MQKIDKINQLIDMKSSSEMSKTREKGCTDSNTYACARSDIATDWSPMLNFWSHWRPEI